jgi:hypothetical protein
MRLRVLIRRHLDRMNNQGQTIMKSSVLSGTAVAFIVALAGCDGILGIDNYDAPTSFLSGRVVFDGQPVGVRSNGVQLELWQPGPEFELNTKIPVHVDQDGSFSARLFDGAYEINLLANNGPWVTNTTRIPVVVKGTASIDVPVVPFYTIRNEQITYNAAGSGPTGAIQATFNVQQVDGSRQLEYVGLYIGTTSFVDRNIGLAIPNAQRERVRSQIQTQLDANAPISISVNLPADIHVTPSPARRDHVFVRVGVKTVGVAEMLFSPVQKIAI